MTPTNKILGCALLLLSLSACGAVRERRECGREAHAWCVENVPGPERAGCGEEAPRWWQVDSAILKFCRDRAAARPRFRKCPGTGWYVLEPLADAVCGSGMLGK